MHTGTIVAVLRHSTLQVEQRTTDHACALHPSSQGAQGNSIGFLETVPVLVIYLGAT